MPRCLSIAPHLSLDELQTRYRHAHNRVERSHWQMVWLVAGGQHCPAVARLTGYSEDWVRAIVHRYNAEGPAGLADRRQHSVGHPPLLSPELRTALRDALDGPAPDGGIWTCGKVAAWMAARLGRPVARHESRPGRPGGLQKGGLQAQVDAIRAAYPTARLTLWAEDEHRLGLLPVIRRVWAPTGQRPTAWVHRRYTWLYV